MNWMTWIDLNWTELTWTNEFWKGSLAQKLRFHIFNFHFVREVLHESFFVSLARKLRFQIFNFHFLREVSHEMRFWELADARHAVFCIKKRASEDGWGILSGGQLRIMLGSAAHWNCQFRFATWTFKIWRTSRTIASFLHLPLSLFEESLARKLRSHIFDFQILRDVSCESFVFTSSAFTFWGMSRTKASCPHLPLSGKEVSQESFVFTFRNLREISHCNGCVKVAWRGSCVRNP